MLAPSPAWSWRSSPGPLSSQVEATPDLLVQVGSSRCRVKGLWDLSGTFIPAHGGSILIRKVRSLILKAETSAGGSP